MATKRYTISVLLICLLAAITIVYVSTKQNKLGRIESRVFETIDGWGYDILVNDSLFIHQESIPSLPAKKGFRKKDQAEKTARLIINKMKAGERPTLSTLEVQKICVNE